MEAKQGNYILKRFLKRHWVWALLVGLLLIASGYSRMIGAAYIQTITDNITGSITKGMGLLLVLSITAQGISYLTKWLVAVVCMFLREKLALGIRIQLFEHLNKMSFRKYEAYQTGNLQSVIRNDSQKAAEIIYILGSRISSHFFMLLFSVGYMMMVNAVAASTVIGISILFGIVNQKILRRMKTYELAARKSLGDLSGIVVNCYENTDVAKTYQAKGFFLGFFNKERDRYNANVLNSTKVDTWRLALYTIVNNGSLYGSAIFLGYAAVAGRMTLGEVLVFMTLLTQVLTPVEVIFRWMASIVTNTAAWERVYKLLSTGEENPKTAISRPLPIHSIRVQNISYNYGDDRNILDDFGIELEIGNTHGIIGESGSGKTTLLKILLGIYTSETMTIHMNGAPIKEKHFSGLSAFVPSDNRLLHATIYENITLGNPAITRETCMEWIEKLGIHSWIASLPQGLDTVVHEGGSNLSGGQGQMVSILRAVVFDQPIVIMDEPFSALDGEREERLLQVMDQLKKYKILLITSHRESTIRNVDRIFQMESLPSATIT